MIKLNPKCEAVKAVKGMSEFNNEVWTTVSSALRELPNSSAVSLKFVGDSGNNEKIYLVTRGGKSCKVIVPDKISTLEMMAVLHYIVNHNGTRDKNATCCICMCSSPEECFMAQMDQALYSSPKGKA